MTDDEVIEILMSYLRTNSLGEAFKGFCKIIAMLREENDELRAKIETLKNNN